MKLKDKQKVEKAVKVMKILNKIQKQTKELRKQVDKKLQVIDENYIHEIEKGVFECSLWPVDIIGDAVYLEFLRKVKVKTIAEPNQFGWYHVQQRTKSKPTTQSMVKK